MIHIGVVWRSNSPQWIQSPSKGQSPATSEKMLSREELSHPSPVSAPIHTSRSPCCS